MSRRCSWAARSKAVLKHTGMDGTMAPRVWISNTVTTSYGFLNTCEVSADNRKNTHGSFSSLFEHTKRCFVGTCLSLWRVVPHLAAPLELRVP